MSIENQYFDDSIEAFDFLDSLAFSKTDFIFRGHKKEKYKLTTTLNRHIKISQESWSSDIDEMIDQFRVGLMKLGILPFESDRRIDWLEYARHHGVPTPVLDFSYSPYMALFFAFNGSRINYNTKEKEYTVIYALNINKLALLWATLPLNPEEECDEVMKRYNDFLYPKEELFKDGFPDSWMQFIPFPGKYNTRMHLQQGALLYDTLKYNSLNVENLDELIEKHKKPDTSLPDSGTEKSEPTLYKIFINKKCVSDIFAKLELMGINGGFLYKNSDSVAQDVINSYNYNSKTSYLRDMRIPPPDDTKISRNH